MIYDYFIIESLESTDLRDGKILYNNLIVMGNYRPKYFFVEKKEEFKLALKEFEKSGYRYLFISAHGDEENIYLSEEEDGFNVYDINNLEIQLEGRRIFLSTCRGGNYLLAKYFIKKQVFSVIGLSEDLGQAVAVALWPTLVIVFDNEKTEKIGFKKINSTLKKLSDVYNIKLIYFSFIRNKNDKIKKYTYKSNGIRKKEILEI